MKQMSVNKAYEKMWNGQTMMVDAMEMGIHVAMEELGENHPIVLELINCKIAAQVKFEEMNKIVLEEIIKPYMNKRDKFKSV